MSKMLSNKKIINEIRQNQQDYVNTRPEMIFKPFVSNRAERDYNLGDRMGGYKSLGQHPRFSASINNNTAFPDPLYGGAVKGDMYNNYLEFNKRYGGALLEEKMPLTGGYHSDSDFCSESESESESDEYETDSDSECSDSSSDYEGGGIYDDYIKPAGKALYNVGHEVFKDVVVPVGKEILKDAIIGLMSGAGRMRGGKITGTKDEYIHILRKINPEFTKKELSKNTKNKLSRMLYKILEMGIHPDDLETLHYLDNIYQQLVVNPDDLENLHYLDALTKNYGQRGGLSGTKKELMTIIKAMYPNVDFKKMTKQQIINEIKKEQPAKEIKSKVKKILKTDDDEYSEIEKQFKEFDKLDETDKKLDKESLELDKYFEKLNKETKKRGRPVKEKVVKEPKKRGRPAKEKVVKEPKKRGRPAKEKVVKEPKKRGRKTKSKIDKLLKTDEDEYKEIEKQFKEFDKLDKTDKKLDKESLKLDKYFEKLNKEPKTPKTPKAPKAPKQVKTKNRITKDKFMRETKKDLFFNMLSPEQKQKAYEEYKKISPMLEGAFLKKYFETNKEIGDKLFKKEGAGIKKIVGTKRGEKVRGDIVAEIMKKKGLNLGQASKYDSEHNLY